MDLQLMETIVLVVHVLAALAVIGLVLIQQGKGADMGSGFGGGASNTVFGSGGSGNFLTRTTTTLAIAFFLTSFGLAFFAKEHSIAAREVGIPQVSVPVPAEETAIPVTIDETSSEVPVYDELPSGDGELPEGD